MMLRRNTNPRVILFTVSKPLAAVWDKANVTNIDWVLCRCCEMSESFCPPKLESYHYYLLFLMFGFGFCFFKVHLFFWLHPVSCGILVPQPGIEPASPAAEPRNLHHWTTREVPTCLFLICVEHLPLDRLKYSILWSRVYHYWPTVGRQGHWGRV